MVRFAAVLVAAVSLAACGGESATKDAHDDAQKATLASVDNDAEPERYVADKADAASLDLIAEEFVKLVLGVGVHDPGFVDAYQGPAEWAEAAKADARPLELLESDAQGLLISLAKANGDNPGDRGVMLEKLTRATLTRIQMDMGKTFPFDEETKLLYDTVAPQYDPAEFDAALAEIDKLLPGEGSVAERVDAFRNSLAIPADKLQPVFDAAIAECRKRTLEHYALPENETFTLSFVTNKPWSGYNWYQGDYNSLIEVNTDFPIIIDRAVDLGCHEGYPGHHTWNAYLERDVLGEKGWIEYSIYPLFSPLSVTAEGSANYGIELAFPGDEKIAFERDVLFPLAGLNPQDAVTLEALGKLQRRLSHASNYIAREYLDGHITRDQALDLNVKYMLQSRERAEQGIGFIEQYRGYVLNYNVGRDVVAAYIKRNAVDGKSTWDAFETLLETPMPASTIAAR